jgi:4-hydroxy-tetrahydrodipicolinate synthase
MLMTFRSSSASAHCGWMIFCVWLTTQSAGVSGVLLAPVSYQRLTEDEVFDLYETVTRQLSVPLCIYDNPATTGFSFSDELLFAAAALPNIGSIKLGRVPEDLSQVRARLPDTVTLGIAGDWRAASALQAGFDVWYSVVGGLFPQAALAIARSKESAQSERLEPLWALFRHYGSLRVVAAAAEMLGKVETPALPFPFRLFRVSRAKRLLRYLRIWRWPEQRRVALALTRPTKPL